MEGDESESGSGSDVEMLGQAPWGDKCGQVPNCWVDRATPQLKIQDVIDEKV